MADIATYKIQFKSDFVLTIHGDAGWNTPFCIKFWTGIPSQAYFVGWDGKEYINCKVDETDASKLIVLFDDHGLPVGQLKMQMAWHTTIADFPHAKFDEVMNQMDVVATVEGEEKHVELAFEGESDPEVEYFLPAYANEAQRIANEQERVREFAQMQEENTQAVEGAENVNATLNGTILTVTNREGQSTSVNTKGEAGHGVPAGGSTGQMLFKKSDADYDTEWHDPHAAGVSSVNGKTGDVTLNANDVGALPSDTPIPTVPTNVSAFNNDAGYITKTVNDLVNYYLKSDTYTKTEVQQLISAIQQFTYQAAPSLPTASADTMHIIYLVPSADPQTQNVKDEYITIDNGAGAATRYTWEQIGSTAIDLSGYYTSVQTDAAITSALNTALAAYATTQQMQTAIATALADYTTTADLTTLLAGKQDVINDLSTIRSGASAGATAVQPAAIADMEATSNKVTTINDQNTNTQYPSAKAVYDFVGGALSKYVEHGTDDTTFMLTPNCFHIWGEVAALTLTLPSLLLPGYEFVFQFTSGATATALSLPSSLKWFTPHTVKDRTLYQVRILNGIASMQSVDTSLAGDPYVDLGLPSGVKWAKRNIDVTRDSGFTSSDYEYDCSFFSWGNIDGHNPTSSSSFSPWDWGGVNGSEPYYEGQVYGSTPGNTLTGNIPVGAEYDAARAILGSPWRMPTSSEYQELFDNTDFLDANGDVIPASTRNKLVTIEGIVGIRLASKINGNELFFACSGFGNGTSRSNRGSLGYYWSSSFNSARYARFLYFSNGGFYPQYNYYRYYGFAVRAVQ